MNSNKTLIFYESRHLSVLKELEKKTNELNIKLILFTNSKYEKFISNTDHYNLNLNDIKFKDIKNQKFKNTYINDIDNLIRDLSNNSHTFDDIINLEMKQKKYGYTNTNQAKLRLVFLYQLFRSKLKKYIGQKVFVITQNAIDIERASFYLACHSLDFKIIYTHSIPIKGNPLIFSEKMYSKYINNKDRDIYERKIIIDGREHAVSQIDRINNPFKYLKRSFKEYKSNSLNNYVKGYHLRIFVWQLERYFYNLINLLLFFSFNLLQNIFKKSNLFFGNKNKHKKNIVFIGSTNNEGFQFSTTKILDQDLILKELSKFKNRKLFYLTYRPHPSSLRERNYFIFFLKILFMGINLDLTRKFKLNNNVIYISLTSSIIYEAFFNGNECYAMIPGFYNLLGLETSDLKSIKFNIENSFFEKNSHPKRELNYSIIKDYCYPGNLYYLKHEDIVKITSSFCNIVLSQN